ncbi:hypothetical protein [Bacillus norwichensis]|uniref:Uncharacterized protein n=1 Tax=Bacillus norwichensis TaxID=2762217 RepID=A0ABR8VT62_9BACI|nr:hypothetical protein [Bacillus norwichensis]MBD8007566.1 hypothetical protein [Bacillus norwichensis]
MNDIETYKTRKKGYLTPNDVMDEAKKDIAKMKVKRAIAIIQDDEDGTIYRFCTEMDQVELVGLLEATKMIEFLDE